MPRGAKTDWLDLLREEGNRRDRDVKVHPSDTFQFQIGDQLTGKVRSSAAANRDYENPDTGQSHIWLRYGPEKERINKGAGNQTYAVVLDVETHDKFDPSKHHFLVIPEQLIEQETYSQGDQKIWIEGEGEYSGPLAKYVDDWDALFDLASTSPSTSTANPPTGSTNSSENQSEDTELPDGNEDTDRREQTTNPVQRNEKIVREMKRLYNHTCQVCGDRRLQSSEQGYSYVHHIMPLGDPHNGPDIPENVVVVCPNHHDDFDNGMLEVDPQTLEIEHSYEVELSGEILQIKGEHEIGPQFLAYHNQIISSHE